MDALKLTPLIRPGVKYPGGVSKSERNFLDFLVNGQSLWEKLGKAHDMVSILCAEFSAKETEKAVKRLLLSEEAILPDDRRSLFLCSECGGLGCGTITALVERRHETMIWKSFGYENNYENRVELDEYSSVGPFTFEAEAYDQTLLEGVDSLRRP